MTVTLVPPSYQNTLLSQLTRGWWWGQLLVTRSISPGFPPEQYVSSVGVLVSASCHVPTSLYVQTVSRPMTSAPGAASRSPDGPLSTYELAMIDLLIIPCWARHVISNSKMPVVKIEINKALKLLIYVKRTYYFTSECFKTLIK